MKDLALTTIDNPYNPFTNWGDWIRFDEEHGYYTCAYLARIANTANSFTDEEETKEIERAMNEIVRYCPEQNYAILVKNDSNNEKINKTIEILNKEAVSRAKNGGASRDLEKSKA